MIYGTVISDIGQYLNENPFLQWKELTVNRVVSNLITVSLIAASVILVFLLIIGGIRWLTAGGDKEKAVKAKETLTAAVIGIFIVLATWAIISLIQNFFGIKLFVGGGGGSLPNGSSSSRVDCAKISISCPSGWEKVGSPYCEQGGTNTCKLKCCYQGNCNLTGNKAPWWQDSGINCWP